MSETMTQIPSIRRRHPPAWTAVVRHAALLAGVVAALLAADAGPGAAQAQEGVTEAGSEDVHPEAREAIGRLKSPYCPGLMLEVCPSGGADDLRDTLNVMAQQGVSSDSLVEWTLGQYGEEWRAVPQAQGTGLWAWVIPPAVLLAGIVVVVVTLRRLRGDGEEAGDEGRQLSDEDERKLERALQELEREGR